ncbi:hypothetical protein QV02_08625 [Gallibacterium anatis]|uniref:Uncharacterized protein n=2 Tax=Gallibacterium anatis TaxID=750 RepID=A0A1A7NWE6_9PAST|nr:hypothetical protein QV02_08625 [Gallibacterium anatis]OBW96533.1 hypothetical protein QV03_10915 [Gallibacterium anatis]
MGTSLKILRQATPRNEDQQVVRGRAFFASFFCTSKKMKSTFRSKPKTKCEMKTSKLSGGVLFLFRFFARAKK